MLIFFTHFIRALLLFSLVCSSISYAKTITIGVLAYDGKKQAQKRWQPTADYLNQRLASYRFSIIALSHQEFEFVLNKKQLDFVLTNPGHYVKLEVKNSITRIATFMTRIKNKPLKQFSSVLFSRSDSDIKTVKDLKGKRLAAVSRNAFGGFQLVHDHLLRKNINVLKSMNVSWLGFPHADVVKAVLSGNADAGIVRSGVLEKMANQKLIYLSQITVLDRIHNLNYPLLHSVPLYPEWPFSKLPYTDDQLAKKVAIALLKMPKDDTAAISAGGAGWTIPLEYSAVHRVLKRLHVAPYPAKPMSIKQLFSAYGHWLSILAVLLTIAFIALWRLFNVNKQLRDMQIKSQKHQFQLEEAVQIRTEELKQSNVALQAEIEHHIKSDQSLQNCCEAMQGFHDIFLRDDLTRQQRVNSIIESVRLHLGCEMGLLCRFQNGELITRIVSPQQLNISAPLSLSLSLQAIDNKQAISTSNDKWKTYIANPIFIKGKLHSLFEFASSQNFISSDNPAISKELSMKLLNLISLWLSFEIDRLDKELESNSINQDLQSRFSSITKREKDVLALLVKGDSTKIMARTLHLSTKTIEMHRANLIRKTQAKSSTELVQLAVLSNIIDTTQ